MRKEIRIFLAALSLLLPATSMWASSEVGITPQIKQIEVLQNGKPVIIERNQDHDNMVDPDFSMTSRPCPPYCVQPMQLATGVETIGELELINYLTQMGVNSHIMVIDSRETEWLERSGMIPGAVNIPWIELHPSRADPEKIADMLEFKFGVIRQAGLWNFSNAKTLVLYCNGSWCGQSPTNIKQLLAIGYPAHKIKWYRGGMQDWKSLGFNTVPYVK